MNTRLAASGAADTAVVAGEIVVLLCAFGQPLPRRCGCRCGGPPDLQEDNQGEQTSKGSDDVGEFHGDVIAGDKLTDCKRRASNNCGRPDLANAADTIDEQQEQ